MEESLPLSLRWMAVASPQGGALSLSLQPEAVRRGVPSLQC